VRKFLPIILIVGLLSVALAAPVSAKVTRGTAPDVNAPALGDIDYLFNPAGFHFWFTPTADLGPYVAGHSYHNVYKYSVDDPSEWCVVPVLPDREPYNLGGTAGEMVYYKIWDTTTDTLVMPPC
jgi:hypothetical protein